MQWNNGKYLTALLVGLALSVVHIIMALSVALDRAVVVQ
jgi:hypothetical protein